MDGYHENLADGTYLRHVGGGRIRVIRMQGTMAYCENVRRDGQRDQRTRGWSGSLPVKLWNIEPIR